MMTDDVDTPEPLTPWQRVEYGSLGDRFTNLPERHLYVARVRGTTTPVKIGKSINVANRLKGLQTSAPIELVVSVPEWVVSEAEAHAQFAAKRTYGEWFEWTDEMAAWVVELPKLKAQLEPMCRRIRRVLRLDSDGRDLPAPNPLRHLVAAEKRVAAAIMRREYERLQALARERREREREEVRAAKVQRNAAGCGVCGRAPITVVESPFVNVPVCWSCKNWLTKHKGDLSAAQVEAEAAAAVLRKRADDVEHLTAVRIASAAAHQSRKRVRAKNPPLAVEEVA